MPGTQYIEGLSSGLDITSIVDKIMEYEAIPKSFIEQDKDYKTQQVAAYQAVQAKFLAMKAQVSLLKRASNYQKANINISDESYITAVSSGDVVEGSYDIQVKSLALNDQIASQGFDDATNNVFGTGTIELTLGDGSTQVIQITEGENSLVGIKDAINDSGAGVTASIINDGTSSNPYRLLLSGNETGAKNKIEVNVNLTGGEVFNFSDSSFDSPENVSFDSSSTSSVSLGASASYSGAENKVYSFTVAGVGEQTIGTDNITLNWTDGTNSGSIIVTQADTEVELFGDGADGLKLSFSAGKLNAGDTFDVGTFSPVLQKASDAKVAIGGNGEGGSPLIINSSTNTFKDVLPSMTFTAHRVTAEGQSINVGTSVNTDEIRTMIEDLIDKYNDTMSFIDDQFDYNTETSESGVLFNEFALQTMQSTIRFSTTGVINGLENTFNSLGSIGIRTGRDGQLSIVDSGALNNAIENDLDEVISLFTDSGTTSSPYFEFIGASEDTIANDEYDINITRAATKGYYQGAIITDPSVSGLTLTSDKNTIKLKVDGVVSNDIVLSQRTYESGADLAKEIQSKINNDAKIGTRNLAVEWVELGNNTGYIKFTSGTYGSSSKVEMVQSVTNSALNTLGLTAGSTINGDDVEGTINGEKATGKGQYLTADDNNTTTAGLKIKVTLTSNMIGSGAEGTITYVRGLGSKMDQTLESITRSSDGAIERRVASLNAQIQELNEQISDYEAKLDRRRDDLYDQFLTMEDAISQYNAVGQYLTSQLDQINKNWAQITKNNSK